MSYGTRHQPLNGADSQRYDLRYPIDTDALLGFLDIVTKLHASDETALLAIQRVRIYVTEVTAPTATRPGRADRGDR